MGTFSFFFFFFNELLYLYTVYACIEILMYCRNNVLFGRFLNLTLPLENSIKINVYSILLVYCYEIHEILLELVYTFNAFRCLFCANKLLFIFSNKEFSFPVYTF